MNELNLISVAGLRDFVKFPPPPPPPHHHHQHGVSHFLSYFVSMGACLCMFSG
jgi:hypothetical protein